MQCDQLNVIEHHLKMLCVVIAKVITKCNQIFEDFFGVNKKLIQKTHIMSNNEAKLQEVTIK